MVFTSLFFIIAEKLIKKPRKYALHPLFFPKNLKSRVGRPAYTFKKNFVLRLRGANRPPGGRFGPLRIASEWRNCVVCGHLQPLQPSAIDGDRSRPGHVQPSSAAASVAECFRSRPALDLFRHQPPSAAASAAECFQSRPALDLFRHQPPSASGSRLLPALDLFRHQSASASGSRSLPASVAECFRSRPAFRPSSDFF